MKERKNFLMCEPRYFGVDYVINPWMTGQIGRVNNLDAKKQWLALDAKITRLGATVHEITPQKGVPDMVFTANAGFVFGEVVVLSHFEHECREKEVPFFHDWFVRNGYYIIKMKNVFEGAGDALYDKVRKVVWCGYGFRTSRDATIELAGQIEQDVIRLRLVDGRWYHLDTCFCPFSNGFVLFYPDAFSILSQDKIKALIPPARLIKVGIEDAMNFACNAVEVDGHVIMNSASDELQGKLRDVGLEPVITPLSEFMKAGGSAKCLTLDLGE